MNYKTIRTQTTTSLKKKGGKQIFTRGASSFDVCELSDRSNEEPAGYPSSDKLHRCGRIMSRNNLPSQEHKEATKKHHNKAIFVFAMLSHFLICLCLDKIIVTCYIDKSQDAKGVLSDKTLQHSQEISRWRAKTNKATYLIDKNRFSSHVYIRDGKIRLILSQKDAEERTSCRRGL